ncbi:MAG TPA: GAF domain-containing protein [Anaerolineae bacterium]|nr:GAF domain-containing protein [Anaerolineae bacterium]HQH37069.1 GAF domain-containing protein [Anaerolineae bacterium]
MWMRIKQFLAPPVFEEDEEKSRVAGLANLIILSVIALLSVASVIVVLVLHIYALMGAVYVGMVLPLLGALWLVRRGHVRAAGWITTIALWVVLAVMGFFVGGVINASFTTMIIVIIIAALLLGARAGLVFTAISMAAVAFAYISELIGILPPAPGANSTVSYFINHLLNYGVAGALLYVAVNGLTSALQRARRLTAELELQQEQLQLLVQQRTRDLERNANYLHATMAVARESAAAIGAPQILLARMANVIQEQFNFYHVGLYLLDEAGEWVELRAVAGAGQSLLERGLRLRVGIEGMVGDVARRGAYHLAADVDQDSTYLRVAELPDTRSELTLPLQLAAGVIGVLDIQSAETQAFMEQDIPAFQALADQISVAISNARLLEQSRQAAEVERRAYGALTGEAWENMLRGGQVSGFYSNARTTAPAAVDLWQPEMHMALQTGSLVHNESAAHRLAVPVKVRGEVIGVVDFAKPGEGSTWTTEEVTLAESLAEQLGVALESARLYQDSQRRAAREQMTREITGRIRETLDVETVLQTAAREIGEALGFLALDVRLDVGKQT